MIPSLGLEQFHGKTRVMTVENKKILAIQLIKTCEHNCLGTIYLMLIYFRRSGFIFKLIETYIPPRNGTNEKKNPSVWEKMFLALILILKLGLSIGSQNRTLVLVEHYMRTSLFLQMRHMRRLLFEDY